MYSEPSLLSEEKTSFKPVDFVVEDFEPFGKVTDPAALVANVVSVSGQTETVALGNFDAQTIPAPAGLPSEQVKTAAQPPVKKDHLSQDDRALLVTALAKSSEEDRLAPAAQTGRALSKQPSERKKHDTNAATGDKKQDASATVNGYATPSESKNTADQSTPSSESSLLPECDGKLKQTQSPPETHLPALLDPEKFGRYRDPSEKPVKQELPNAALEHLDFESQDNTTNESEGANGTPGTVEELSALDERVGALSISEASNQSPTARSVLFGALPCAAPVAQTVEVCTFEQDEADPYKILIKSEESNEPAKTAPNAESIGAITVADVQSISEATTDVPLVIEQSDIPESPTSQLHTLPEVLIAQPTEDACAASAESSTSEFVEPLAQPNEEMVDAEARWTSESDIPQSARSHMVNTSSDTNMPDFETHDPPQTSGSVTQHDACPQPEDPAVDNMDTTDGPETFNSTSGDRNDIDMLFPPRPDSEDTGKTVIEGGGFDHANRSGQGDQIASMPCNEANNSSDVNKESQSLHAGEIFKIVHTDMTGTAVATPVTTGAVQSSGIGLNFASYSSPGTFTFGQPTNVASSAKAHSQPQRPGTSSVRRVAHNSIEPSLRKYVLLNVSPNHFVNSRSQLLARKRKAEAEEERKERPTLIGKQTYEYAFNASTLDSDNGSEGEEEENDDSQQSYDEDSIGGAASACEKGKPLTRGESRGDEEDHSDSDIEQFSELGFQLQSTTDDGDQLAPQRDPCTNSFLDPLDLGENDGQQYDQDDFFNSFTGFNTGENGEQQDGQGDFAGTNRLVTSFATSYSDTDPADAPSIRGARYGSYNAFIADMTLLTQSLDPALPQMGQDDYVSNYSSSPQYLRRASTQQHAAVAPQILQPGLTIPSVSPPFFPSHHPSYVPPHNDFDDAFDEDDKVSPDSSITAESNDQEETTPNDSSSAPSSQPVMPEEDRFVASSDSAQEVPSIPVGSTTFDFQHPAPTGASMNGTGLFDGQDLPAA